MNPIFLIVIGLTLEQLRHFVFFKEVDKEFVWLICVVVHRIPSLFLDDCEVCGYIPWLISDINLWSLIIFFKTYKCMFFLFVLINLDTSLLILLIFTTNKLFALLIVSLVYCWGFHWFLFFHILFSSFYLLWVYFLFF